MRKHNLWMEIKTAARPSFSNVEPKSKVMLQILCAETLIYWWKRPQNKRQYEQKSCRWAAHFQPLSEVGNFFSSSGCPSALLLDLKYCSIICFCFHKNHLPSSCWSPYCYHSIKKCVTPATVCWDSAAGAQRRWVCNCIIRHPTKYWLKKRKEKKSEPEGLFCGLKFTIQSQTPSKIRKYRQSAGSQR